MQIPIYSKKSHYSVYLFFIEQLWGYFKAASREILMCGSVYCVQLLRPVPLFYMFFWRSLTDEYDVTTNVDDSWDMLVGSTSFWKLNDAWIVKTVRRSRNTYRLEEWNQIVRNETQMTLHDITNKRNAYSGRENVKFAFTIILTDFFSK